MERQPAIARLTTVQCQPIGRGCLRTDGSLHPRVSLGFEVDRAEPHPNQRLGWLQPTPFDHLDKACFGENDLVSLAPFAAEPYLTRAMVEDDLQWGRAGALNTPGAVERPEERNNAVVPDIVHPHPSPVWRVWTLALQWLPQDKGPNMKERLASGTRAESTGSRQATSVPSVR